MSFIVEDTGGSFEATPAGMHLGRCYRIIDLGTQKSEYLGQVKTLRKVMLGWEIHAQDDDGNPLRMKDGRPFGMFKNYTLSWAEKANLRADLQSWRGKPFSQEEMRRFDLKTILGAWCMLNVIEKQGNDGKMYVNVTGITPVPSMIKQAGMPAPVNKNEVFMIESPDMEIFQTFSDNLKKKIMGSPEWDKLHGKQASAQRTHAVPKPAPLDDDDIPF
jgi:hypothetical protein